MSDSEYEEGSADDELIDRMRSGDRDAFQSLTASLKPQLQSVIQRQLGSKLRDRVDVNDVVQETHLRALRSIDRFTDGQSQEFFRWLCGIAKNVVLEAAKREKRDLIIPSEDTSATSAVSHGTALRREERFDRLRSALDALSGEHREVIMLARIERLPLKDIAERMGRTTEAISQLLWRALQKLKNNFGETDSFHLPARSLLDKESDDDA